MTHVTAAVQGQGGGSARTAWVPVIGLGLWVCVWAWRVATGGFHELLMAELLFLLAPLVLVPLGLPLTFVAVRSGSASRLTHLLTLLHPIAALTLVPAFALELPWQARAALGLPYVLFTAGAVGAAHHDAPGGSGLRLTSCALEDEPGGDQGVYLVNPVLPLRLPLNETIRVWSAEGTPPTEPPCDEPAVVLRARHEMWFLGWKYLELHYFIERVVRPGPTPR